MPSSFARYPSLEGRSVVVTGGGSGIGAAIVGHFVEQGARVGFIDFNREDAAATVAAHQGARTPPYAVIADLRDIAALRAGVAEIRAVFGPATVLVNNAARDDRHSIDEVTPEYWDERQATNLRHQFFAAQAVKNGMIAAGGGSIINMGSISWKLGQGGFPAYTTAKAAVLGLTRSLARDLGRHHIRVNSIVPGWIMTERQISLWMTPENEAQLYRDQCLPEKLYPPDIARMALWLAADDSRLATSQEFIIDGGWL